MIWLVDTGGFVGYLDKNDRHHERVVTAIDSVRPVMWTTMPVIGEAMYLLGDLPHGPSSLLALIESSSVKIVPTSSRDDLRRCVALMEKYRSLPMDFADASVVRLAEELNIADVLTVDERGFRVFQIHSRRSFHLVLDDFPG